MSSFLPGVLVECGPLLTKLFLFIAVGFSISEKEDEEGQQRGSILQWESAALSGCCWSTGFELGWVFPGFVSCQVKWRGLNEGAASKGQRRSCCLAQLTMPINTLIKYHTLVWAGSCPLRRAGQWAPPVLPRGVPGTHSRHCGWSNRSLCAPEGHPYVQSKDCGGLNELFAAFFS